jgi:serine phosphatase RsbU (regulator of sigma subunit)
MYTDGVSELRDASDEQFGLERLRLFVQEQVCPTSTRFCDRLLEHLSAWSGDLSGPQSNDDLTVVAARFESITQETRE